MSKVKAKSATNSLSPQQQDKLTSLCISYDMACQALNGIGYAHQPELDEDYQKMMEAIRSYMGKLDTLIEPLQNLKIGQPNQKT